MAFFRTPLRDFHRAVPVFVAGLALAPLAIAWEPSPAASASPSTSSVRVVAVTLKGSTTPTLRATVTDASTSAQTPTGTVSFTIDGAGPIGCDDLTTNTVAISGGVATCKITAGLAPGSPQIARATYSGDGGFTSSNGTYTSSDGSFTPGASASPPPQSNDMSAPPGYTSQQMILNDDFSGTRLDTSKWSTSLGAQGIVWNNRGALPSPFSGPNVPGDGNEIAMFGPSQAKVDDGLTLTAQPNTNQFAASYPWISGVVTTEGKFSLPSRGWYVQVLAKMPDQSQGMWPAIWFLPGTPGGPSNEFDGYEGGWPGTSPNQIMHSDYFADEGQRQNAYNVPADVTTGYHVYGFQFVPGQSITAYFDGQQVWQVLASDGVTISGEPYEIILELQVAAHQTAGWHMVTTGSTSPASMEIAEVQAYSSS